MNANCVQCQSAFSVSPCHIKKRKRLFCSRRCFIAYQPPLEVFFWSKVAKRESGCWEWVRTKSSGYGIFQIDTHPTSGGRKRRTVRAHRFSWELHNGKVPDGLQVLHRCDNPACVNPAHLFLGTLQDNMDDRNAKGRQARHARHPRAKITIEQARQIRAEHAAGASALGLSKKYHISRTAIRSLLAGVTWKE